MHSSCQYAQTVVQAAIVHSHASGQNHMNGHDSKKLTCELEQFLLLQELAPVLGFLLRCLQLPLAPLLLGARFTLPPLCILSDNDTALSDCFCI